MSTFEQIGETVSDLDEEPQRSYVSLCIEWFEKRISLLFGDKIEVSSEVYDGLNHLLDLYEYQFKIDILVPIGLFNSTIDEIRIDKLIGVNKFLKVTPIMYWKNKGGKDLLSYLFESESLPSFEEVRKVLMKVKVVNSEAK